MENYLQEAMTVYGVKPLKGDDRPARLVMLEAYLDFETRALFLQSNFPETVLLSERIMIELDEHETILKLFTTGNSLDSIKDDYCFGNGDPTINPLTVTDKELSKK